MTSFFSFIVAAFTRIDLLAIHPQLRLLFRASAGAFFSLHCLIYKVHTVLNGSLLFYHTRIRLSSTFFKNFSNFIRELPQQLFYLTTSSRACQELFSSFFFRLARPQQQPVQVTTFRGACQVLSFESFRGSLQQLPAPQQLA